MNLLQIYSVPLWESQLPDFSNLQQNLINDVLRLKEEGIESPNKKNHVKGFLSENKLQKNPNFAPVMEYVCQMSLKAAFDLQFPAVDVFVTECWAYVASERNDMVYEHAHQETFSGVLYLKIPPNSGKLIISNPCSNPLWQGNLLIERKNKFTADRLHIEPTEGRIFLWPSYITHSIEPSNHDEERISINFTIIAVPKGAWAMPQVANKQENKEETKEENN